MIIGIGLDLTDISRFKLDEAELAWFAKRVFTTEELTYASRKRFTHQHLAGCFAAKEALRKALGHAIPWRAAGVSHTTHGAPIFVVEDALQRKLDARGVKQIQLSITHNRETAAAVVILES
jgi:holo-[acyl-carrier protein] synthase